MSPSEFARIAVDERPNWRARAEELGFLFHTEDGDPSWDESAYYAFTLAQIEEDLEEPSAALDGLCLELVDRVVNDERQLTRLRIPETYWDWIRESWRRNDPSLYGRLDLVYDGNGPAKLLEYNADTPTALYEAAIFQWVWLEEAMGLGLIPEGSDQFNSIHEALIATFSTLRLPSNRILHLTCAKDVEEDVATVSYVEDCARQAGMNTRFVGIEDIGIDAQSRFVDLDDMAITHLFKLYPWEWMLEESYGVHLPASDTAFLEPPWKAILSNKGLLPLLWEMAPGHPNLLPAVFDNEAEAHPQIAEQVGRSFVRKPLYSREGANIEIQVRGRTIHQEEGPYGAEGHIRQAYAPLPVFGGNHMVIGSWIVGGEPCGMGIREDRIAVTRDLSRFVPHIIR